MRRFPRNAQTRGDALSGPGHLFQNYRRDALGRKSEDARYAQDAAGAVGVAAGGSANVALEAEIVAGGDVLTLTISGPDAFTNPDGFAALIAALPVTDTINTAFDAAHTALSADGKTLTLTMLAIAGYTLSADAHYGVTIPAVYFRNRSTSLVVANAINVTNA